MLNRIKFSIKTKLQNGSVETVVTCSREMKLLRNAQSVTMLEATLRFGVKTTKKLMEEKNLTEEGQIYLCEICGNKVKVLESGSGTLVCCGQDMTLVE